MLIYLNFRFFVDKAASAANAVAVSLAAIRGEGLGISLAAPTLTGDMTFEEMQNERAARIATEVNRMV